MPLGPSSSSQPSEMPGKPSLVRNYVLHVQPSVPVHAGAQAGVLHARTSFQKQDPLKLTTIGLPRTGRVTLSGLSQHEMDRKSCCDSAVRNTLQEERWYPKG